MALVRDARAARAADPAELPLRELAAPGALCSSPALAAACEHALARPGKRLRPRLLQLSARHGPGGVDLRPAAVAVELLHTATLVHDDVVDSDASRRGAPSVWAAFGPSGAAYSGAWLLARATELVCTYDDRALELFARTAETLLRGQVEELSHQHALSASTDCYREMVARKTAAMFAFAAELGATLAGADDETVARLREFGTAVGIAFQIADDVVDFEHALDGGSVEKARSALYGLPLIYALEARPELAQGYAAAAGRPALHSLAAAVTRTGGVELARRECERYAATARAAAAGLSGEAELVEFVGAALRFE